MLASLSYFPSFHIPNPPDGAGGIEIMDLETLQLLHSLHWQNDVVTALVFTSNSLRIVGVGGTLASVWKPSALINQDTDSVRSDSSEWVLDMEGVTGHASAYRTATTTALYCCDEHSIGFCGRNTSTVDICTLNDPENTMTQLYRHRGTFTSDTLIDWAYKPHLVISADSSNCFRVM